ncbi:MAG: flagellar biosynthesis protein FlhA [Chlamydiales bacterium]|nr:flagellar biosynthesis protein FlhA [Chlamydiales bacterium]NCF70760.1 flagellar biosynthesis protein FlhA [Chlamydiales bacterium]
MLDFLSKYFTNINKHSDAILSVAVVSIVLLLVIPLPPVLLDLFLSLSIVLAVTTLLVTLYITDSLEFNAFPSLLLFLTLFRLGLNIASTRMILAEGEAGDIIKTFGNFVTGGNLVVGLVIFILLTVINFVVITKGSGRIAEVAARFTLDAMPGKQMSIDADLNAGLIDEQEAKMRREKITSEADFYGAMDGASKFVRGDAIAGIIITVVNILGGLAVGMLVEGFSWAEALDTYMVLTVGDGLVSQIPALLISVGSGVIVTRASESTNLGFMLQKQVFNNPRVLFVTAGIVAVLGIVPGMPMLILYGIAGTIGLYAYVLWKTGPVEGRLATAGPDIGGAEPGSKEPGAASAKESAEDVEKALYVDPMEIELGYGLIPLVDPSQGGDLLNRITMIRRQVASDLGLLVPPIRIRDNMALDSNIYVIKIKGIEVASGTLHLDSFLAMNPGTVEGELPGIKTHEPAFGLPAVWISQAQKENAEAMGYTVVDTLSVLATHLTEEIHTHAHELLNRQEAQRLIDNAKVYASAVIEELIPNQLALGQILKVLQNLLRERIPIRDIVTILETLADHANQTKESDVLTEYVRQAMARTISKQYHNEERIIHVITLDSKVEQMFLESIHKDEFGSRIVVRPQTVRKTIEEINQYVDVAAQQSSQVVVLTTSALRLNFRHLIERNLPRLPVLSFNEIAPNVKIEALGAISSEVLM